MKQTLRSFFIKLLRVSKDDLLETFSEELKKNTHDLPKEEPVKDLLSIDQDTNNICFVEPVLKTEIITKPKKTVKSKQPNLTELTPKERAARDLSEMMEVPFLALSKNRKRPIMYEKTDGKNTMKVNVFPPLNGFIASIYDWDIVLFVAGKIQKILNDGTDIPPRRIVFPRHEILKSLRKHDGKKEELDLRAALSRLQETTVKTTIRNEDGQHGAGFGFLDSWGYTTREDVKEIWVILSNWLYEGICAKGSLLMVDPDYFSMTSGLKRFLYRTARKHVGIRGDSWTFLIKTLYEKSGSEQNFRYFKSDLKNAVLDNDIPGYNLKWIEEEGKIFISFEHIDSTKVDLLIN